MSDVTFVRRFSVGQEGKLTTASIAELSNGNMWVCLKTNRDGMDALATEMVLSPDVFNLLSYALSRAAHDSTVWNEAKAVEDTE